MDEIERRCIRCNIASPIDNFRINRKGTYNKICETCLIKIRAYQHENKEAIAMKRQIYYKNNREAFRVKSKQWRLDNAEKNSIRHKKYYMENRKKLIE